jgi:hypothetical protein
MNKIIIKTGLGSSVICLAALVVWVVSFTGIALSSPLFYWTNLQAYIEYVHTNNQFFQYLAKSFMIVFALGYMILSIVFYEFAPEHKRVLAKIATTFAILFAMLASVHYYIQISAVRFAFMEEQFSGLEHFIQARPTSLVSAINMLGWTIFLGLSSLFMYGALLPKAMTKGIRIGLLINAISCLGAGVGYLFQIDIITFIGINLGMGIAFFIMTMSSTRYFLKGRIIN